MIINTLKLLTALNLADTFLKLSKFFPSPHKGLIRTYSNGDGKLYLIMNNAEDMKVCQNIDIDPGEKIDTVYSIVEFYNIVKNVINYSTLELKDDLIIFPDGHFTLVSINFPEEKKNELFNLNFTSKFDSEFSVTEDVIGELRNVFRVLTLKSDRRNSYFHTGKDLFFNFSDIFVKRSSTLSFLVTDIFSLRLISLFLLKNKGAEIKYSISDDTLTLASDNFILESIVFEEDQDIKNYLQYYFETFKSIDELKIKLEFFNFISAVNYFDPEASLLFGNGKVLVQSRYQKFKAEFSTNIDSSFIIGVGILFKIFDYIMKNNDDNFITFHIGSIGDKGRFIQFNTTETNIITEII